MTLCTRLFAALALLGLLGASPAMAASHSLAGPGAFSSADRVSDSELDENRGGTLTFSNGVTLSYLTIEQSIETSGPAGVTSQNSTFSFGNGGSQATNLAQAQQIVSQTLNINTSNTQVSVQNNVNLGLMVQNMQALQGAFHNNPASQLALISNVIAAHH